MTDPTPSWSPFQPDVAPDLPAGRGHVVAVVGLPGAEAEGWAPGVAVELARAWSRAGHRVVLADLGLSRPLLHAELGLPDRDGLSDAVVFGASVARVTEEVDAGGSPLFFISAGTAVADPAAVVAHPRWRAICDGFREAGATLVAFLPWGSTTAGPVLEQATDVVYLGAPTDDPSEVGGSRGARPLAFVGRGAPVDGEEARGASAVPTAAAADGPATSEEPGDSPVVDAGDPAAPAGTGAGPGERSAAEEVGEPDPTGTAPAGTTAKAAPEPAARMGEGPTPRPTSAGGSGKRSGGGRLLLVFLFLVLAAVIAWLLGVLPVPGATRGDAGTREVPAETVAPLAAAEPGADAEGADREAAEGGPAAEGRVDTAVSGVEAEGPPPTRDAGDPAPPAAEEVSPPAAWAVSVEAHADPETARSSRRALERTAPDQLWITVPVEVDGTVFHRVLFGTAPTWAEAQGLHEDVARRIGRSPSSWISRPTRLAYRLDERPALDAARARASELQDRGVPAYVLAVRYADGSERFRVYAGGFADAREAAVLGARLAEAGVTGAELVQRTGRLPG